MWTRWTTLLTLLPCLLLAAPADAGLCLASAGSEYRLGVLATDEGWMLAGSRVTRDQAVPANGSALLLPSGHIRAVVTAWPVAGYGVGQAKTVDIFLDPPDYTTGELVTFEAIPGTFGGELVTHPVQACPRE